MKIRIKGNAIRFRLTKTEVATLCTLGHIAETTDFNDSLFSYAISVTQDEVISAEFKNATILLKLPESLAKDWAANNIVGFENVMLLDDGKKLSLLLEKDFTCMDNTIEDQSDNYPNPKAIL